MFFALTFSAFGDFVSLTQLILGTCQILLDSYDATKECTALVEYLTSFNNALECIRSLIHGNPVGIQFPIATVNALRTAVAICERDISKFEKRIVALRNSNDRSVKARLGAAAQRLKWTMSLDGEAADLRRTLAEQKGVIDTVLAASLIQQTANGTPAVYSTSINNGPRSNGVELIDILDQRITVPIECCFSFETFNTFLRLLYSNRAGASYVRDKQYCLTLHEGVHSPSLREVSSETWSRYIGCGVVLEMAVRAPYNFPSQNVCPTCRHVTRDKASRMNEYRCSWCQTAVIIDLESQNAPGYEAEQHDDWRFMRRIRYEYHSTPEDRPSIFTSAVPPFEHLPFDKPFDYP